MRGRTASCFRCSARSPATCQAPGICGLQHGTTSEDTSFMQCGCSIGARQCQDFESPARKIAWFMCDGEEMNRLLITFAFFVEIILAARNTAKSADRINQPITVPARSFCLKRHCATSTLRHTLGFFLAAGIGGWCMIHQLHPSKIY